MSQTRVIMNRLAQKRWSQEYAMVYFNCESNFIFGWYSGIFQGQLTSSNASYIRGFEVSRGNGKEEPK